MIKTICIAGKNDIAVRVLSYCLDKYCNENIEIAVILTRSDIGINSWQRSLKWYCEMNNVRIISIEEAYEIENLLFLSLEFDRIIKTDKFKTDKLFNIHFSLLPQYKGMYPAVLPILHDQEKTGVTLHRIRDGIDTGEIIAQRSFKIEAKDNSLDIYKKLINNGAEVVIMWLENLLNDNYNCVPQNEKHSTYFSSETIDYSNLRLDARRTAYQVQSQIRAFAFRPYQLLTFYDHGIIESEITDEVSDTKPGTILNDSETDMKISTIDYNIILYKDVLEELFDAIKEANNVQAKLLCKSDKIINDQDQHGWSPLTVAVYNNNFEMVKYLVNRNADLNILNVNGTNLLMYAKNCYVNTGDATIFEYLISRGLNPEQVDYYGKNLYEYCKEEGIRQIGSWKIMDLEKYS